MLELETNYLVSKGYSWTDVRTMESWRRKNYCQINSQLDKDRAKQIQSGGPQVTQTVGDFI